MRVRFLGSGDAFGSGGRFQTCICLEADGTRLLLDCGASSMVAMRRFGVDPALIDIALISHLHGDHFGGLPFLILHGQFARRTRPLTIAGPPGIDARLRDAMEVLFPGSSRVDRRFTVTVVELQSRQTTSIGAVAVTPFEVVHASGAPPFALRVACAGKVVAYSGDTEWTDALVDAARDADLFVCEAYHFDKMVKYHLDYRTLSIHRARLGCRRLVLTHMSEDMLAHAAAVDVEAASDGLEVVV